MGVGVGLWAGLWFGLGVDMGIDVAFGGGCWVHLGMLLHPAIFSTSFSPAGASNGVPLALAICLREEPFARCERMTRKQPEGETSMDRSATAVWHGTIKEGSGTISTQSGTLKDTQYSFKARFAEGVGTNPEELIAAAHAGCFTMALSGQITNAGFTPDSLETTAVLTLDMHGAQPTITKIHLTTKAKIPGIDKAKFDELAHNAEVGCPVSRVLKAAEITLDATLL